MIFGFHRPKVVRTPALRLITSYRLLAMRTFNDPVVQDRLREVGEVMMPGAEALANKLDAGGLYNFADRFL